MEKYQNINNFKYQILKTHFNTQKKNCHQRKQIFLSSNFFVHVCWVCSDLRNLLGSVRGGSVSHLHVKRVVHEPRS